MGENYKKIPSKQRFGRNHGEQTATKSCILLRFSRARNGISRGDRVTMNLCETIICRIINDIPLG